MNRLLVSACASLAVMSSSGCATLSALGVPTGGALGAAVGSAASIVPEGVAYGEQKCKPLLDAEPSWVEERAMGGAVGVKLVSDSGHLVLDGMTEKDPGALAKQAEQGKVKLPESAKNDLTTYISGVGRNLARSSERPELPWTFAVIENETPNAFSAPGGYVVVTTGLLRKITNEAQLAGVLGHEIAHVVHKHSLKKYKVAKHAQCVAASAGGYMVKHVGQAALSSLPGNFRDAAAFADKFDNFDLDSGEGGFVAFIIDAVMTLVTSGNDKEDEFQADRTALELVAFAGYDTTEYEKFLTSLGSQGGGLFASHPSTTDRVAKLKAGREGADLAPFASGTAKPETAKYFAPIAK